MLFPVRLYSHVYTKVIEVPFPDVQVPSYPHRCLPRLSYGHPSVGDVQLGPICCTGGASTTGSTGSSNVPVGLYELPVLKVLSLILGISFPAIKGLLLAVSNTLRQPVDVFT